MENTVEPNEMARYKPSDLDLYCLGKSFGIQGWKG